MEKEKEEKDGTKDAKKDEEEPSVKVFIRPLEVTVPADFLFQKPEKAQKTYWSTMTSHIATETSVNRWSTEPVVREEGRPPGPEDFPSTKQGREQDGNVIGITPNYKIGEQKPNSELNLGKTGSLPRGSGDYKMTYRQEDYKQTIIDPKVITNANMPYISTRIPDPRRNLAGDFPSEHSKSKIKLDPLEQRRFRSSESRPITTSNYLAESVDRHREMEASRLREYLKAKENEANQPWNKPGWPGPKKNDESLRELETMKQRIETLKRDANKGPVNAELDELSKRAEELRKRDGWSKYKLVESDIYKTDPDPMPANIKDQVRDLLESRNSVETTTTQRDHDKSGYVTDVSTATWNFSTVDYSPRSVVSMNGASHDILKDDKPRSIMKRNDLVRREQMLYPTVDTQVVKSVVKKPTVTETVQRFEETRRTEEVERRVQRREKKERRSRHHSSSRHHSGWEGHTGGYQGHRSSSLSRGGHGGGGQETYYRQETTRRQQHNNYDDNFNRGIAHARYGSLSDSLRRGELQYVPNGEVRQSFYRDGSNGGQRMHKSYSTRDVFTGDGYDDRRSVSSFRRGSQQQVSPFVEFPPTLPRRGGGGDYRREEDAYFRPVSKSRSYADWDDAGRAGMGREVRRYDDDMSRLEAEFRDSLLMPMPAGNMNERDHRTEQLPGGYETFNKERHANSGRRSGRDGKPVDFNEATQEYNYKREQTLNDDRRRR
ncbi:Protein pat-12 [Caenorhabditis elegans]|nr:Protein pat-12 [Caenorhabditis elegans]CCD65376.1 Protein pat-12 [Caenorhabditis elegans]|eukprot:NP_741076.1 Protein pat-12 [Caenorhabditis elegans]